MQYKKFCLFNSAAIASRGYHESFLAVSSSFSLHVSNQKEENPPENARRACVTRISHPHALPARLPPSINTRFPELKINSSHSLWSIREGISPYAIVLGLHHHWISPPHQLRWPALYPIYDAQNHRLPHCFWSSRQSPHLSATVLSIVHSEASPTLHLQFILQLLLVQWLGAHYVDVTTRTWKLHSEAQNPLFDLFSVTSWKRSLCMRHETLASSCSFGETPSEHKHNFHLFYNCNTFGSDKKSLRNACSSGGVLQCLFCWLTLLIIRLICSSTILLGNPLLMKVCFLCFLFLYKIFFWRRRIVLHEIFSY